MKRLLWALSLCIALIHPAFATNVNIDGLPAASSANGTDLLECEQSGTNNKCTSAQVAAYIYGLMSGDATAGGTGAVTFKTVNANVGSFGSATQCTAITVNAKGLITAASAATCTPAVGSITGLATGIAAWLATPSSANLLAALTTSTGTGSAVFGTAPTISSLNATTAVTLAFLTGGGTQCLTVGNTGLLGAQACTSGGTVTSVSAGCGLSTGGSAITTTGTVTASATVNPQSGTTYTLLSTDCGQLVQFTSSSAVSVTVPQATGSFAAPFYSTAICSGAGGCTLTPTTSTIDGASSLALAQNESVDLLAVSGNYITARGRGVALSRANTWTGSQTFATVNGSVNAQSGTTYTLAATDCGKTVIITNASAITLTTLNSIPAGCAIAVEQGGAGQITVSNGSGATLTSAHSYTKTFSAVGAIIGLFVDTNSGTNAHFVLTGDGA